MSKKAFTPDDLMQKALDDFNGKVPERLYGTSDGHLFLPKAKTLAQDHANKAGLKLHCLEKADIEAFATPKPQTQTPKPKK